MTEQELYELKIGLAHGGPKDPNTLTMAQVAEVYSDGVWGLKRPTGYIQTWGIDNPLRTSSDTSALSTE